MTARIERSQLVKNTERARALTEAYIEKFRAPFTLRCGALLIDYIIVAAIIALSTLLARQVGVGTRNTGSAIGTTGWLLALGVAVLNFGVLTSWRGQTLGKWATGLRIEHKDGQLLSVWRSLLRHFVGYPLSLITLGIGFLFALFNSQGRALHDLIAGTVVVQARARQARAPEKRKKS